MQRVIYLDPERHYLYDSDFKLISTDKELNLSCFPPIDDNHVFGGYECKEYIVKGVVVLLMKKVI